MNGGGREPSRSAARPRMLAAVLLACAAVALAAPDAMSAGAGTSASGPAAPLWRAYPLEQTTTTLGGSAVASTVSARPASSRRPAPAPGGRTPWVALLLTAIAVVLSAASLVVGRRSGASRARAGFFDELEPSAVLAGLGTAPPGRPARGRTARDRVAPGATKDIAAGAPESSAAPDVIPDAPEERAAATDSLSSAPAANPAARDRRTAVSATPPDAPDPLARAPERSAPAFAEVAPTLKPVRIPTRAAEETAARAPAVPRSRSRAAVDRAAPVQSASAAVIGRQPPPPRKAAGPICQIRWLPSGRGCCFSAVTTDGDGVERTVATSPQVEWHARTPPEQTREAQAALRRLSKTLRDNGWRPMRMKGKDFDEPQWYARRFRYPEALAETDRSMDGHRGPRVP